MAARETIPTENPAPGGDVVVGLRAEVARLSIENQLLRERIDQILRQRQRRAIWSPLVCVMKSWGPGQHPVWKCPPTS